MTPTSRLYDARSSYLGQHQIQWRYARHLQTLCWMIIGMIQSQNVQLNGLACMSQAVLKWLSHIRDGFADGCRIDALMLPLPITPWSSKPYLGGA